MDYITTLAVIGLALIGLEFMITGVYIIWWGLGMCVASLVGYLLNLPLSATLFIIPLVSLPLCWYAYKKMPPVNKEEDINNIDLTLKGKEVVVLTGGKHGRCELNDGSWSFETEDELKQGDKAVIEKVNGATLIVKKQN